MLSIFKHSDPLSCKIKYSYYEINLFIVIFLKERFCLMLFTSNNTYINNCILFAEIIFSSDCIFPIVRTGNFRYFQKIVIPVIFCQHATVGRRFVKWFKIFFPNYSRFWMSK